MKNIFSFIIFLFLSILSFLLGVLCIYDLPILSISLMILGIFFFAFDIITLIKILKYLKADRKKPKDIVYLIAENYKDEISTAFKHYKLFYKKYGCEFSDEKISKIITNSVMLEDTTKEIIYLISQIPTNPPSPEDFLKHLRYYFNYMVNISTTNESLIELAYDYFETEYSIQFIKENKSLMIYVQKEKSDNKELFRFNYEQAALGIFCCFLEDVADKLPNAAANATKKVNDYAQKNGYTCEKS